MITLNQIKLIKSLKDKKQRDEHNLFIAEGGKLFNDIAESKELKIKQIFATSTWLRESKNSAQFANIEIITEKELERISALVTPNQLLALVEKPVHAIDHKTIVNQLSIALDNVKDPGNLGTIIRLADWFGIKDIFCSLNSADAYNSKVVQASMGSIGRVKVHYLDLNNFIAQLKSVDYPIYGTFLEGKNIYKESLSQKGLIVMGNESNGVSQDIENLINQKLTIPSFSNSGSGAESLNVAIATAIVCSEFRKSTL